MNDVSVLECPSNLFVSQLDQFQMVVFFFRWVFDVVHFWCDFHDLDVFQLCVEILNFLPGIVDFVPFELGHFKRLPGGHGLVEIGGRSVYLLSENKRRMNARAG